MKKIWEIIVILILFEMVLNPVTSAVDNESDSKFEESNQPCLEVEFKGSSIIITNCGEEPVNNVEVHVWFEGLVFINKDITGTIATIMPGESYTFSWGLVFGIGPVIIHVEVTCNGLSEPVTAQAAGFMLGPLLLGLG